MLFPRQALRYPQSFSSGGRLAAGVCALALSALFLRCDLSPADPAPSFPGLAAVRIVLTPEAQQMLATTRGSNAFVIADVTYDDPEQGIRKRWMLEMRNAGQFSRRWFQRNYRLRFPDGDPFRGYTILNLSSQPTDRTKLRSRVGYEVLRGAGFHVPMLEPVAVYINGRYEGLSYLIEPIDKGFFDRRGIPISSLFEARLLEARWSYAGGFHVQEGYAKLYPEDENFSELDRLLRTITGSTPENIAQNVAPIFDLDSYLAYQAGQVVAQNDDGWTNNFHLYHDTRTGKLHLQPWDLDHSYDVVMGVFAPTAIGELVAANPFLRRRYLLKVLEILDGPGHPGVLGPVIGREKARLADAFNHDPYLRAGGWTMDEQARLLVEEITASHLRLRDTVIRLLAE